MKSKKIEPSVQTFVFTGNQIAADEDRTMFIDLSQCASIVNRRFYRQGLNWAVGSIRVVARRSDFTNDVYCPVTIQKLPNTWVMSNAWEKGFRAWQEMNKKALASAESVRPKFLDFKIYADNEHHRAGFGDNLLPVDSLDNQFAPGEWVHSTYHIPNSIVDASDATSNNPRSVIAVGPNYQATGADGNYAVSLIEGYASSRGLPDILDPNTPDDAASVNGSFAQNWIVALHNDHDQQEGEVLADMITENNQAPYPFENDGIFTDTMYPGGANQAPALEIHDESVISSTTVSSTLHLKGGNFPCGLIGIRFNNFGMGQGVNQQVYWDIFVDMVPGSHRGYLAEPMTEM